MKEQQYQMLVSQIASLIEGETDEIAIMSNVAAAIHQEMHFWWTGFYRVAGEELLLGPFHSQVTLLAVVRHVQRSSCRCSIKTETSSPYSTSTVNTWQPSTTSTVTILSRSVN